MSTLTYNSITLDFVETRTYDRTAIMDGPTYLYTRHTLGVVAIYNPERNSYDAAALPTTGVQAPSIDIAIRHRLMIPRKKLLYKVGTTNVLLTPVAGRVADANNGPLPLYCHVEKIHGKKTFKVYFVVQADVNECTGATPPIILSHRWTMEHDIDEHFYTVRTIRGWAILRTDHMLVNDLTPDQYRSHFIHPIPQNFKRMRIHVVANEDGNELEYTVVDQEMPYAMDKFVRSLGVTKIEAFHNFEAGTPSFDSAVTKFFNEATSGNNPLEWIRGAFRGAAAILPHLAHTILVRVWGNRTATRSNLESIGWHVVRKRLEPLGIAVGSVLSDTWVNLSHDLMNKWVEVTVRRKVGPIGSFMSALNLALSGNGNSIFPSNAEYVAGVTQSDGPGHGLNVSQTTVRGTWLGELVAQALQEPCEAIPTVANADTTALPSSFSTRL